MAEVKTILSAYYHKANVNLDGKFYSSNISNLVNKYIAAKKPLIGHFNLGSNLGHDMCICGYVDININYKEHWYSKNTTSTIRYYKVNDGFKDCESGNDRLQYVNSKFLRAITRLE